MEVPFRRVGDVTSEVPREFRADMRVPIRVLADAELLAQVTRDRSLEQLVNVATLPGITRYAIGMPDMRQGYGFPVGGVAGTVLPDGVISPGGIGFDINCGVRLLAAGLDVRTGTEQVLLEPDRLTVRGTLRIDAEDGGDTGSKALSGEAHELPGRNTAG